MTKKEKFIKFIQSEIFNKADIYSETYSDIWEDVNTYWDAFKGETSSDKPTFTDNGKLIMEYLQSLPSGGPMLKAKDIAEGLFISSRTVSGSIRKLVTDGYVEKAGQDPVMYALTDEGKNVTVE